jgi:SPP1 gp7 family putative phage head morphogenesis protein
MSLTDLKERDFQPMTADAAAARFASKTVLTSDAFDALAKEAQANAFRIAKIHNLALLQEARDIIHRGIRDGLDYGQIRRALQAVFDRRGLPQPSMGHLMTIWRRNSQQAYNDSRRKVLETPEARAIFQFWRYTTVSPTGRAGGVRNVRATHAALHGKVFLVDDPFWNRHFPPWEWGCRCYHVAMMATQVKRSRSVIWTYSGGRVMVNKDFMQKFYGKGTAKALDRQPVRLPDRPMPDKIKVDLTRFDKELRDMVREAVAA